MANALNDGLNKPSIIDSINGYVGDFGTFTGSGNTTVVTFSKTFSATPVVDVWYSLGSLAVASSPVISNLNAGSFSCAAGSNLAFFWTAIGSGTY